MTTNDETVTVRQAAELFRRNPRSLARKIQRARLEAVFSTSQNPGSPKRHYRIADIRALLIDRRYGPRSEK